VKETIEIGSVESRIEIEDVNKRMEKGKLCQRKKVMMSIF
jgi:hypothetical protein